MHDLAETAPPEMYSPGLSHRESEVLKMVATGLTNVQIARRLDVTVHGVKFHLTSIYRKLGVSNRTEAAVLFTQHSNGMSDEPE
jgi:DNA-binding CsgD family transcriptional regulator